MGEGGERMKDIGDIGFYTLSEGRIRGLSPVSPIYRLEIILTGRCNFRCPYCRGLNENYYRELSLADVYRVIENCLFDGLKNIRFSGGEPTTVPYLGAAVKAARDYGVERIAVSTNGSASQREYGRLLDAGVNDFSISLDACCASAGNIMSGTVGRWKAVVGNIRFLSDQTYTTVGIVLNERNIDAAADILNLADSLGVADIRIIPAAQYGRMDKGLAVSFDINKYPILKYRLNRNDSGLPIRGLSPNDAHRCSLVKDDLAVMGDYHFPCIIYMRERGVPIGKMGANFRRERMEWSSNHNIQDDPICSGNCLDVCVEYNNRCYHA
jgi:pyruvate-formate lyase-activating enzyme